MKNTHLTKTSDEPLNIAQSPFAVSGSRSAYRENILLASGISLVLVAITMVVAALM